MKPGDAGILQNMHQIQPFHDGMLVEIESVIYKGQSYTFTAKGSDEIETMYADDDFYAIISHSYLFGERTLIYTNQIRPIDDPDKEDIHNEKCETISKDS